MVEGFQFLFYFRAKKERKKNNKERKERKKVVMKIKGGDKEVKLKSNERKKVSIKKRKIKKK